MLQAARLIHRVQPEYPVVARRESLQGTVKLHALIAIDGTVQKLYVVKGYCSLAQAALDAVHQWKYQPTLLGGQPVEVDTEIDVIYELRR
jgi:protein TonB